MCEESSAEYFPLPCNSNYLFHFPLHITEPEPSLGCTLKLVVKPPSDGLELREWAHLCLPVTKHLTNITPPEGEPRLCLLRFLLGTVYSKRSRTNLPSTHHTMQCAQKPKSLSAKFLVCMQGLLPAWQKTHCFSSLPSVASPGPPRFQERACSILPSVSQRFFILERVPLWSRYHSLSCVLPSHQVDGAQS